MTTEGKRYLTAGLVTATLVYLIGLWEPFAPVFDFSLKGDRALVGWGGTIAALMTLIYSARKRELLQWPGRLIYWKIAHVAAGLLFCVLVALHAGGKSGEGIQLFLSALSAALFLTGAWGIMKQGYIPRLMTKTLLDPVYRGERAEDIRKLIREIDVSLDGCTDEFREVYQRHILPFTAITLPDADHQNAMLKRCFGPGDIEPNAAIHDLGHLDADEKQLFYYVAEKGLDLVEIRRSRSYQGQMNRWLWWHIAFAIFLVIALFFHILASYWF